MSRWFLLFPLVLACDPSNGKETGGEVDTEDCRGVDLDGDGFTDCDDCDDADALISPNATEVGPDGLDNDCNGVVDDVGSGGDGDTAEPPLVDDDLDGYPTPEDCDDDDREVHPGADELCDELDNDCDGEVDEEAPVDAPTWFQDQDGDGYGDPAIGMPACTQPEGWVLDNTDCDDLVDTTSPGAPERCDLDNVDEDCDGVADDDDDSVTRDDEVDLVYADVDGDGYGDQYDGHVECDPPEGFSWDKTDCDDSDDAIHPGAAEICDPLDTDEDCDGDADDADAGVTDALTWYNDQDDDGFGGEVYGVSCEPFAGTVLDNTDCDDVNPDANPGLIEVCDDADVDEDCSGYADDADPGATELTWWYLDYDDDGYGDPSVPISETCEAPGASVGNALDCDDADAEINPSAVEVCDPLDVDEDCDGKSDDSDPSAEGEVTWTRDADGDGFGGIASETRDRCDAPAGYVLDATDCDDTTSEVYPGALEKCNYDDDDCDGLVDISAVDADTWYQDSDGDGYGDESYEKTSCTRPSGYVDSDDDCDDTRAGVHPGATEYCVTSFDDDCDGSKDAYAVDADIWYRDSDSDGYGAAASTKDACTKPTGYVSDDTDCDDTRSSVNPGKDEVCDSSDRDEDCDGASDDEDSSVTGKSKWYVDSDSDGYGAKSIYIRSCDRPTGSTYSSTNTDCDDDNAAVNPGEDDTSCNGLDDNCGGVVDVEGSVSECATGVCNQLTMGDGHSYLLCEESKTWAEADAQCQAVGYHLATIDDEDEEKTLITYMGEWGLSRAWIGLKETTSQRWVSQESMEDVFGYGYCPDTSDLYSVGLVYSGWITGQPDHSDEDCAELRQIGSEWGWNDYTCSSSLYYICESCDPL